MIIKSQLIWIGNGIFYDDALIFFANIHPIFFVNHFLDDFAYILWEAIAYFDSFEVSFRYINSFFILALILGKDNLLSCLGIEKVSIVNMFSELKSKSWMEINAASEVYFEPNEKQSFFLFA